MYQEGLNLSYVTLMDSLGDDRTLADTDSTVTVRGQDDFLGVPYGHARQDDTENESMFDSTESSIPDTCSTATLPGPGRLLGVLFNRARRERVGPNSVSNYTDTSLDVSVPDTCSTATLPGPGRMLGVAFGWIGRRVERWIEPEEPLRLETTTRTMQSSQNTYSLISTNDANKRPFDIPPPRTECPTGQECFQCLPPGSTLRMLLLGCGESGKSTLFHQLMFRHGHDISGEITVETIRACRERAINPHPEWSSATPECFTDYDSHISYYRSRASIIEAEGYKPTAQDILMSYSRTIGAYATVLQRRDQRFFKVVDTAGQRSERRKFHRIYYTYSPNVLVFVMSLGDYNKPLMEDPDVGRMEEAFSFFSEMVGLKGPSSKPWILVLTMKDVLAKSLLTDPFENYFPDYTGSSDPDSVVKYVKNRCSAYAEAQGIHLHIVEYIGCSISGGLGTVCSFILAGCTPLSVREM
ncbi:G-protein alpha subunit-domain-containing protein [Flagelloscypha sp. PMI_526]|nr:G-protein alpha subunit-domain-containing protein [Flagelloscypha sp. PMI_526]